MATQYYSRNKKKRRRNKAIWLLLVLVLFCAAAVTVHQIDRGEILASESADASINVTEINGIRCQKKTRVKTYLIMGIDASGEVQAVDEYDGTGQCDLLELLVIDQNANTYALLPIDRNTITAVNTLTDDGTYVATTDVQISFAHANGDGMEMSCENTVEAVSHLLYDQPIDGYAALNMDAIQVINHMVGGVTVTIEDDFSAEDETLKMGETITLNDEQAVHFVRGRMSVGDGTNENRMHRQKVYLEALQPLLMEKAESEKFVLNLYDALQDYMVTTLTGKDCSKMAKAVLKNESLGTLQIEGENSIDEYGFVQFIPDQDSLADVVIQLFYERLDERAGETNESNT